MQEVKLTREKTGHWERSGVRKGRVGGLRRGNGDVGESGSTQNIYMYENLKKMK